MLPSTETLRCFVEAAHRLHFRAAARACALTPTAFGQRIQKLEEQVGKPLFQRTTRSVTLTRAGLALLPRAERLLVEAAECLRAAAGEDTTRVELTLGTRHELGLSWLVPLRPSLMAEYAGLILHLYFGSSGDLLERVRAATIDCCVGSMRLVDGKLDAVRLHEERYVLVGAPRLLRARPLARAEEAAQHTLVDASDELPLFRYLRDASRTGDRLRFGSVLRMGTIEAVRRVVLDGEGVAVLPRYHVARDLAQRRLLPLLPRLPIATDHFRLVFRSDDSRRPLYERMAETMLRTPLA